jgi:hypothetical protein
VYVQDAARNVNRLTFRPDVEGVHDARRRVTAYTCAVEGPGTATMRPGDILWAEVGLRDAGGGEWKVSWWANGTRSAVYQFDRLTLPPRLHRPSQKPEDGDLAAGVTLTPTPDRGLPRVPDLLPAMR